MLTIENRAGVDVLVMGKGAQPATEGEVALFAEVVRLRADAERMRGLLLWALYHHQGGSSGVGQPIRMALGIGQHDAMTPEQIRDAARAAQGDKT